MNAEDAPRAWEENPPEPPPNPPPSGGTDPDDEDVYEDVVHQLRSRRTGQYRPGPGGPKRNPSD